MSKYEEFIAVINTFKAVSPSITPVQRLGLLKQAVHNYELSIKEAAEILNSQGLIVTDEVNLFEVLELSVDELQYQNDAIIETRVDESHKHLYSESLRAGGLPRKDGRTQEQWRNLLNQARETLIDPEKRKEYLSIISQEKAIEEPLDNLSNPIVEFQNADSTRSGIPQPTALLTPPSENTEQNPTIYIESFQQTSPPNLDVSTEMVLIPADEFQMGGQVEESNHTKMSVQNFYIDGFMMDIYPVSNAQYKTFLEENHQWQKNMIPRILHNGNYLQTWSGNNYPRGKGEYPVVDVCWYAAMAYAEWVGKRLPTEIEWEKAARGGLIGKIYPWGDEINVSLANYGMHLGKTTPVGKYPPNAFGLYDVVGNVWEWCLDEYDEKTTRSESYLTPNNISKILDNYLKIDTSRVLRGGSWASSERAVSVAYSGWAVPNFTYYSYGFRCVSAVGH
ncbi:formylglycine-generating enzyme family protein [Candidatus Poribacteria bacterium]|nr:formylglycine-generating enzyme family protein [Candidatus Poribacteria bacterium]